MDSKEGLHNPKHSKDIVKIIHVTSVVKPLL